MGFLAVTALTCIFAVLAAPSIKKAPLFWYGVAIGVDLLYFFGVSCGFPSPVLQVLSVTVQRGLLATALFIVVMYCGVLPERSSVRERLMGARAELALIASILAAAHCANYLGSYAGVLLTAAGVLSWNQSASLTIALVLLVLLVVLGGTSVKFVRRRMRQDVWKFVQRSSYGFFALIYVHELLVLYPSAAKGHTEALVSCVAGGVVFSLYFVLRVRTWAKARAKVSTGSA